MFQIICDRYDGPDAKIFSEEIAGLLEDNFYVPVLRSEDNCAPPIIGTPFSPTSPPVNILKFIINGVTVYDT